MGVDPQNEPGQVDGPQLWRMSRKCVLANCLSGWQSHVFSHNSQRWRAWREHKGRNEEGYEHRFLALRRDFNRHLVHHCPSYGHSRGGHTNFPHPTVCSCGELRGLTRFLGLQGSPTQNPEVAEPEP